MPKTNKQPDLGNWRIAFPSSKLSVCNSIKKILGISTSAQTTNRLILTSIRKAHLLQLMRDYCYAVSTLSTLETDVQVTLMNGEVKWFKIIGMPLQQRWGKIDGMIGTVQDISQRVYEESFSLSVINHELRNPLTIAVLNTQMVIKMLAKEENRNALKLLKNAEIHLHGMTTLMEEYFTHTSKERLPTLLNKCEFDLNKTIDVLLTEIALVHRGYRFAKIGKTPCIVHADKYKIIQVIINYLTNAITHSPKGSQIIIDLRVGASNVEVSVTDKGSGIPKGAEELIFEKYYQAEPKEKPRHNKGLGLYLVKNIIQSHGGTVGALRNDVCGSTFYFKLPILHM